MVATTQAKAPEPSFDKDEKSGRRKGQVGGAAGKVLSIGVIAMILLITVVVFANFDSSVDTGSLTDSAQEAVNSTTSNAYGGFNLAAVLPIAIAGVAVLGIIVSAFMGIGV